MTGFFAGMIGDAIGGATAAEEATAGGEAEASWGSEASGEESPGDVSVQHPDGHQFQMNREQLTALLHSDPMIAAIMAVANRVKDDCNSNAQIEDAEYGTFLQTTDGYVTPQVLVMPSNYVGVIDDAAHSTMMVAAGNAEDAQLVIGFVPETSDPEYPEE